MATRATSKETLKASAAWQLPNLSLAFLEELIDNCWNYNVSGTFTASDTTPSVSGAETWTTANTAATNVSTLDDGFTGQKITIIAGDANTTFHFTGGNMVGNGGARWKPAVGEFMNCVYNGTSWYCVICDSKGTVELDPAVVTATPISVADVKIV